MSQYQGEYETFFKSPAGLQCLTTIKALIDSNHQAAEDKPENARDYIQRAKGNREVLNHINTVMNDTKVNPYSKAAND
jgi:hypothetical protein